MRLLRFSWSLLGVLVLAARVAPTAIVRADDETSTLDLILTPQAEPVPALRYRLLPSTAELNPGNAVPVYLRFFAEQSEAKKLVREKAAPLLAESSDAFPVDEARDLTQMLSGRLQQLAFAARRDECDWAYPLLEQREQVHEILLPDIQEIRLAARLLALKARVEIARDEHDEAIRTIETGLAMARHISEPPFLVTKLVGIAVADEFLDRVEELISRPDAPNLSWALASLPRPLIDIRGGLELEGALSEWILPELAQLDQPRTEAEWESRLVRLHERLVRLQAEGGDDLANVIPGDIGEFRAEMAADALAFFEEQGQAVPESESEAEQIIRSFAGRNRRILDEELKTAFLPIDEALPLYARRADPKRDRAAYIFIPPFTEPAEIAASLRDVRLRQAALDRRVAAFRVIEAIRWHASANEGTLPASLDAIEVIPVPVDPITGRPFVYRTERQSALLESPPMPPSLSFSLPIVRISYRFTFRE